MRQLKKLICAKQIEEAAKNGEKVIYIEEGTLLTPSAKDVAKANGITFQVGCVPQVSCCESTCAPQSDVKQIAGLDANTVYKMIKALAEKGMLDSFMNAIANPCANYVSEKDACGLKIVRGNTVKLEVLDTGNPNDKVFYQEIVNNDDGSSMNAGIITIENCKFDWETACEELYHVVEGTLTITRDGKQYVANPGDTVFFPKGVKLAFGSPNKMKAFYATY